MRALFFRVALATFLTAAPVVSLTADCVRYECRRSVDTATWWERYGPLSQNFRKGSSCTEGVQCTWYYVPDHGWGQVCDYTCIIEPCYDV